MPSIRDTSYLKDLANDLAFDAGGGRANHPNNSVIHSNSFYVDHINLGRTSIFNNGDRSLADELRNYNENIQAQFQPFDEAMTNSIDGKEGTSTSRNENATQSFLSTPTTPIDKKKLKSKNSSRFNKPHKKKMSKNYLMNNNYWKEYTGNSTPQSALYTDNKLLKKNNNVKIEELQLDFDYNQYHKQSKPFSHKTIQLNNNDEKISQGHIAATNEKIESYVRETKQFTNVLNNNTSLILSNNSPNNSSSNIMSSKSSRKPYPSSVQNKVMYQTNQTDLYDNQWSHQSNNDNYTYPNNYGALSQSTDDFYNYNNNNNNNYNYNNNNYNNSNNFNYDNHQFGNTDPYGNDYSISNYNSSNDIPNYQNENSSNGYAQSYSTNITNNNNNNNNYDYQNNGNFDTSTFTNNVNYSSNNNITNNIYNDSNLAIQNFINSNKEIYKNKDETAMDNSYQENYGKNVTNKLNVNSINNIPKINNSTNNTSIENTINHDYSKIRTTANHEFEEDGKKFTIRSDTTGAEDPYAIANALEIVKKMNKLDIGVPTTMSENEKIYNRILYGKSRVPEEQKFYVNDTGNLVENTTANTATTNRTTVTSSTFTATTNDTSSINNNSSNLNYQNPKTPISTPSTVSTPLPIGYKEKKRRSSNTKKSKSRNKILLGGHDNDSVIAQPTPLPPVPEGKYFQAEFGVCGIGKNEYNIKPGNYNIETGIFGDDAGYLAHTRDGFIMGIADGASGNADIGFNPADFPSELMKEMGNAIEHHGYHKDDPKSLLLHSFKILMDKGTVHGSCTLSVATLNQDTGKLCTMNVGDSGFRVYRQNEGIIFKSFEEGKNGDCPKQVDIYPWHRELMEQGIKYSAINLDDISFDEFTAKQDDVVIISTDGLYDNLYDNEVEEVMKKYGSQSPNQIAEALTKQALVCQRKPDDMLIMVFKVKKSDQLPVQFGKFNEKNQFNPHQSRSGVKILRTRPPGNYLVQGIRYEHFNL
ncbi:hypothetical protein SNEBB_005492 [Seison nebaliae]|nr:hypothetical protein SNEBB_005492 [Seison nebaliae]